MEEGVVVHDGDLITFTTAEDILGTAQKVFMKYQNFPNDVNPESVFCLMTENLF
jgi:pyruvate kinase